VLWIARTGRPWRDLPPSCCIMTNGATYLRVRDGGRIVSVAATIAVAVNTVGRCKIVELGVGPSEAEPFWSAFLKGLVKRGGVKHRCLRRKSGES
jgi:transposase-like protein